MYKVVNTIPEYWDSKRHGSPRVVLEDEYGGQSVIYKDDHCYVLAQGAKDNPKGFVPVKHWYQEAAIALRDHLTESREWDIRKAARAKLIDIAARDTPTDEAWYDMYVTMTEIARDLLGCPAAHTGLNTHAVALHELVDHYDADPANEEALVEVGTHTLREFSADDSRPGLAELWAEHHALLHSKGKEEENSPVSDKEYAACLAKIAARILCVGIKGAARGIGDPLNVNMYESVAKASIGAATIIMQSSGDVPQADLVTDIMCESIKGAAGSSDEVRQSAFSTVAEASLRAAEVIRQGRKKVAPKLEDSQRSTEDRHE